MKNKILAGITTVAVSAAASANIGSAGYTNGKSAFVQSSRSEPIGAYIGVRDNGKVSMKVLHRGKVQSQVEFDAVTEKEFENKTATFNKELTNLKKDIQRVDREDQRVKSGEVSGSNLQLTTRDMLNKSNGADIRTVDIDMSGLVTDQGTKNAQTNVSQNRMIFENTTKINKTQSQLEQERIERLEAAQNQKVKDARQDFKTENNSVRINKEVTDRTVADKQLQTQISSNRTSVEELYALDSEHTKVLNNHESRIGAIEKDVQTLKQDVVTLREDVTRLDGAIAANAATASMIMPKNWDGKWAAQVGVGFYNDQSALALGLVAGNEDAAARLTVAGSSADDWHEPVVGASLTVLFGKYL